MRVFAVLGHEPIDEFVGVAWQAEVWRGLLEGIQERQRLGRTSRQPLEAVGPVIPGPHLERDSSATAGPNRGLGKALPWRLMGAIINIHRVPPQWLDRDGQAGPVNGNANFRLTRTASFG